MSIDRKTAARVAHLARIKVHEGELDALASELSAILGFMDELSEVDIEGVAPLNSVHDENAPMRADLVQDGKMQDRILSNAPDAREGFFAVPKVVE